MNKIKIMTEADIKLQEALEKRGLKPKDKKSKGTKK
jgi:hypothetical protein